MRILEVIDKTVRVIYLTQERWSHLAEHGEVTDSLELIGETLRRPDKMIQGLIDEGVMYYFRYQKTRRRFLLVVVKYLNGEGFIITSYFVQNPTI